MKGLQHGCMASVTDNASCTELRHYVDIMRLLAVSFHCSVLTFGNLE